MTTRHLRQMILACFPIVPGHITFRAINSSFILKLGLNVLLPWSFGRAFGMGKVKREGNFTDDRSYQTIIIHGWHVMGLYTKEGSRVDQLLRWEFVPILNKISNILTNGKNNGCCMFTRDSQHFPTPTCASMLHNVHIQEGHPDMNPKYSVHERSDWIYLTLGNFLQHFVFNFWPYRPFQLFDSSLCLTSIEPNLAICSITKLQME